MIFVGLDDTDVLGAPGTNHLARRLARSLQDRWHCRMILRHQLLVDDRIPYTSKNSSASLALDALSGAGDVKPPDLDGLFERIADWVSRAVPAGSDPGLCIARADGVAADVSKFGRRCQMSVCTRDEAERAAAESGLRCAGLAGSELGVIGAVAAVGLAATGDDGRLVMIDGEDDLSGNCSIAHLRTRRVEVRCHATGRVIDEGEIELGKHLRPNWRSGRIVLYAAAGRYAVDARNIAELPRQWTAVRLP
jgi:hypothetical protein